MLTAFLLRGKWGEGYDADNNKDRNVEFNLTG